MVHFFNSLLPTNLVKVPSLISAEQLTIANGAIAEAQSLLTQAPLAKGLEMCQCIDAASAKKIIPLFQDCISSYRAELYKPNVKEPFHRLQLHQAIMAAGFYERAANSFVLHGEGTRFVLNHYNFDVRRDTEITRFMHANLVDSQKPLSADADKLLSDLLLLERRLFGPNRLVALRAKQWLVCGVPLSDIKNIEEVKRLLDLSAVKTNGNFKYSEVDEGEKNLFTIGFVEALPEVVPSFQATRDIATVTNLEDLKFSMKIAKPLKPLTRWERIREKLLRLWVLWLSFWISFWFVDEEVITLVSMVYMKIRTTKIQKALAEEAGDEHFYVARAKPARFTRDYV